MTNKFSQSFYMIANAWNDSRFTATRIQQHPLSYAIWQQLKNTNCTHKFHFPPEFGIIYCQEKNLLKRNFSKLHGSTQQTVNCYNRLLYLILLHLQKAAHLVLRTAESWSRNALIRTTCIGLTEEFQELSTRVCFHGCGRTVYITEVGGREGNYPSWTTSGLH